MQIRSGHAVVEIAPESCGALTRFAWELPGRTIDWLRPALPDAIATAFPQGMSCFPLVPFSNRIRNGRFTFRGREIQLPPNFPPEPHAIHGDGWHAAWRVVSHEAGEATIEYAHRAGAWPFPYTASQRIRLTPDDLELEMSVRNDSSEPMPAGFGFHPYFKRTPGARLRTAARAMWENDAEAMPSRQVAPPHLDGLDPDAIALDNNFVGWSGTARIEWPEWNARLVLTTDGPFTCLVIYTPPGRDFFCAEPVTNCIDAFNLAAAGRTDTGMLVIEPGATIRGAIRLTPAVDEAPADSGTKENS